MLRNLIDLISGHKWKIKIISGVIIAAAVLLFIFVYTTTYPQISKIKVVSVVPYSDEMYKESIDAYGEDNYALVKINCDVTLKNTINKNELQVESEGIITSLDENNEIEETKFTIAQPKKDPSKDCEISFIASKVVRGSYEGVIISYKNKKDKEADINQIRNTFRFDVDVGYNSKEEFLSHLTMIKEEIEKEKRAAEIEAEKARIEAEQRQKELEEQQRIENERKEGKWIVESSNYNVWEAYFDAGTYVVTVEYKGDDNCVVYAGTKEMQKQELLINEIGRSTYSASFIVDEPGYYTITFLCSGLSFECSLI